MKVLLIDNIAWKEHISYNNYWIKTLNSIGIQYDFACINGYAELLTDLKASSVYNIEGEMGKGGLKNSLISLIKLARKTDYKKYDYIIFTAVNKLAFVMSPFFFRSHSILVSHVWQVSPNIIHRILYKLISSRHLLISLDRFLETWLKENGIRTIAVPHPLPKHIRPQHNKSFGEFKLFSPSKSIDKLFLEDVINNLEFHRWLETHNVKLIIQTPNIELSTSNIVINKGYISQERYEHLFNLADAILVAYPESFKTRVSNVFFEAIAAQKPIILKEGTHLDDYLSICGHGIYTFDNLDSLKEAILFTLKNKNTDFECIEKYHSISNMIDQVKNILSVKSLK